MLMDISNIISNESENTSTHVDEFTIQDLFFCHSLIPFIYAKGLKSIVLSLQYSDTYFYVLSYESNSALG